MIIKLLGAIDLGMALTIVLTTVGFPIGKFYILIMMMHALKAIIFIKDVLSVLDLVIVTYTLILPFYSNPIMSLLAIIFLSLKGIYSFA